MALRRRRKFAAQRDFLGAFTLVLVINLAKGAIGGERVSRVVCYRAITLTLDALQQVFARDSPSLWKYTIPQAHLGRCRRDSIWSPKAKLGVRDGDGACPGPLCFEI